MSMSMSAVRLPVLSVFTLACLTAACGDDKKEAENPNAEACEHLQMGPPAPVTAAPTPSTTAPRIDADHKRYDVTLVTTAAGKGGFVTFQAAAEAEYLFFTDTAVTLSIKDGAMADVAPESSASTIPECTQVKGRHAYDLKVGPHVIGIAGTTADQVSIVVEVGEHEH